MTTDLLVAVLDACRATPDAPALSQGRRTLSYGAFESRIASVASSLRRMGFLPGDRVLFSVRPNLDGICLALGIISAGGTVVFADPGAGESMFRARAALASPRWVAAEAVLYAASSGALRGLARRRGLELPPYAAVIPDARHLYAGRWLPGVPRTATSVASLFETDSSGAAIEPIVPATHEALVIFTSGTTGAPKAVVHSRASLGTGLAGFAAHARLKPGDRVLTDQLMIGIPALIAGAHWRLPLPGTDPGAKPERYLESLPETDALFMVPASLDALLRLLDSSPSLAPALTTLLIGGAPVLRPLLERARARWPSARILAIYGMTEILPVAIADGDEKLAYAGVGDFVGELLPEVGARIEGGELMLSGPGLALGYLADLPQHPLIELGTGDLATIGENRLVLVGRSKDMFIRGSTNVYPGLYESVISGIPGVADAAMVGVPAADDSGVGGGAGGGSGSGGGVNRGGDSGDERIVLVIVPAKDAPPRLTTHHPLIAVVAAALPGLIDAAVLPDLIVAAPAFPRSGRGSKLDRPALATLVIASFGAPFGAPRGGPIEGMADR